MAMLTTWPRARSWICSQLERLGSIEEELGLSDPQATTAKHSRPKLMTRPASTGGLFMRALEEPST
jgi:hypothetical protein